MGDVEDRTTALPMFPLGSVLVPSMVLPLHVFEERYRRLVRDCLDGTPEFGVVLISRGSEVGGGDVRTEVGTVARMVEAAEMADGRYALRCVGTRRIRVRRWLGDDPYPRAEVEVWADDDDGTEAQRMEGRDRAVAELRRALALQAEMGEPAPPATVEVDEDPAVASHQIAALAPIGPLDRQRLLEVPGTVARLREARRLLVDAAELLVARLAMGD